MLQKAAAGAVEKTAKPEFEYLLRDLYARLGERDRWDEEVTKFLLYANGGGVALTATFAGVLVGRSASVVHIPVYAIALAILTAAIFTFGIFIVGKAIFVANEYATNNRKDFRKLVNRFVNEPDTSYADVFLTLSTLSNKRNEYTALCRRSFDVFILGVVMALGSVLAAAYLAGI